MIRIYCDAADAVLKETQTLTAGMINYPEVLLTFSDAWDGYGKAVIVKAGEVEESALIVNNKFVVPSECLAESGVNLIVGVSGSDGVHTIPTIWCSCGEIMDGTDVNDSTAVGTATPSLVEQMLGYAQDVVEEAQYLKDYIIKTVAADATGANAYGTANVTVSDSGEGENRTITFTFTNLKGNGITSLLFTASGENKGRVQVKLDDGTTTNYDGIKEALAAIESLISDVETAETARDTAETARNTAEGGRESAEQSRSAAEASRETAEAARQNAEGLRDSNEGVRVQNEAEREENENTRQSNEAARVSAETARAEEFAGWEQSGSVNGLKAEGFATGQQNGVDVGSGSPYYHNNSKYYMNEAGSLSATAVTAAYNAGVSETNAGNSATSAGSSASSASASSLVSEGYALGKQGGNDVGSTSPYYHNNAKYYSDLASGYVDAADDWLQENISQETGYVLDRTLLLQNAAAPADIVGKLKTALSEPSKNINTSEIGKFATNSSGTIISSNASLGMASAIACTPNTKYTASFYDATSAANPSGYVTYYSQNGSFVEKSSAYSTTDKAFTFTTPSTAYKLHVSFYKSGGFTFGENVGIQVEKGAYKTEYVPPIQPRGYDELTEKNAELQAEIKTITTSTPINIIEPELFGWVDNPLHGKIHTDYRNAFTVDFDVSDYKNADGNIKYVSPNGSDSNDGLSANSPLLSIKTAYNSGANTIVLLGGIYRRANTLYGVDINRSLNIIGDDSDGDVVVSTNNVSIMTLLDGYSHVYSATRINLTNVIDIKNKNRYGDYTQYSKVETIADVEATEGTYAHLNGVAYVHTIGDVAPTEANGILLMAGSSTTPLFNFIGSGTLYMENVVCLEGSSPLKATASDSSTEINVYAKNCKFFYSYDTSNDACMMQGTSLTIFQNCEASYAFKDGFNYHSAQGIIPKAVEINCTSKRNGTSDDGDDQGSSIHDGGSIIRINCTSYENYGSNYADHGAGTESLNINCMGFKSNCIATTSQNANFFAYEGTKVFLDSCIGFGSTYNINITVSQSGGGLVYLRNNKFTGVLAPENFVPNYY